jgi:hypothetical protein
VLVEVVLQVVELGLGKKTRIEDREGWKCCCLKKTLIVLLLRKRHRSFDRTRNRTH